LPDVFVYEENIIIVSTTLLKVAGLDCQRQFIVMLKKRINFHISVSTLVME